MKHPQCDVSIFVKCLTVVRSCNHTGQLDVALKFIQVAGLSNRISIKEWDLLFQECQTQSKLIISELLTK